MTLAYSRGLLKSGYDYGVKSRLREELLLQVVSQQEEGDQLIDWGRLDIQSLPVIDPNYRQNAYQSAIDRYIQGRALKQLYPPKQAQQFKTKRHEHSDEEMANLFKILKNSKVFSKMDEMLEQEIANNQS